MKNRNRQPKIRQTKAQYETRGKRHKDTEGNGGKSITGNKRLKTG